MEIWKDIVEPTSTDYLWYRLNKEGGFVGWFKYSDGKWKLVKEEDVNPSGSGSVDPSILEGKQNYYNCALSEITNPKEGDVCLVPVKQGEEINVPTTYSSVIVTGYDYLVIEKIDDTDFSQSTNYFSISDWDSLSTIYRSEISLMSFPVQIPLNGIDRVYIDLSDLRSHVKVVPVKEQKYYTYLGGEWVNGESLANTISEVSSVKANSQLTTTGNLSYDSVNYQWAWNYNNDNPKVGDICYFPYQSINITDHFPSGVGGFNLPGLPITIDFSSTYFSSAPVPIKIIVYDNENRGTIYIVRKNEDNSHLGLYDANGNQLSGYVYRVTLPLNNAFIPYVVSITDLTTEVSDPNAEKLSSYASYSISVQNLYYECTLDQWGNRTWKQMSSKIVTDVIIDGNSVVSNTGVATVVIPAQPTISTNIKTDKASDVMVASPKSVYDEVHPATSNSIPAGGLVPNVLYKLGTLTGSVTIVFATPEDANVENEYKFTFDTSSTAPTITWPAAITKWAGNALDSGLPNVETDTYYEVSVVDGLSVFNKFE